MVTVTEPVENPAYEVDSLGRRRRPMFSRGQFSKRIGLAVTEDTYEALFDLSVERQQGVSSLAREAIDRYLQEETGVSTSLNTSTIKGPSQ